MAEARRRAERDGRPWMEAQREHAPTVSAKGGLATHQAAVDRDRTQYDGIKRVLTQEGSYRAAAAQLNELGLKTRRGGRWTATTVRRILLRVEAERN